MTIQNIYDAALRILAESDNGDVHYLSTNLDIHMFLGCRFGGTLFVKMIRLHSLPPRR